MKNIRANEPTHTPEQRAEILTRMKALSNAFYDGAARAGCHAFIEFTGLMNEYLAICHEAEKLGVNWVMANTHNGTSLPIKDHHGAYLAEKLNCIYGPALLSDERVRNALIGVLFEGKYELVEKVPKITPLYWRAFRLTKAQQRMLACAVTGAADGPYELASHNEIKPAQALHQLGLGTFDDQGWYFAANDAGRDWIEFASRRTGGSKPDDRGQGFPATGTVSVNGTLISYRGVP